MLNVRDIVSEFLEETAGLFFFFFLAKCFQMKLKATQVYKGITEREKKEKKTPKQNNI